MLAVPAGTANDGGAGSFGGAAGSVDAAGGRDGGRGGAGRLRFAEGGADSGRWRTGGGGGKLRCGPSEDFGEDGGGGAGAAFDALELPAGAAGGRVSRGRGGAEGGTEVRPAIGRGGEGFLDWFASSAMVHELTPSLKRAKREHNGRNSRASNSARRSSSIARPSAPNGMLCGGAL